MLTTSKLANNIRAIWTQKITDIGMLLSDKTNFETLVSNMVVVNGDAAPVTGLLNIILHDGVTIVTQSGQSAAFKPEDILHERLLDFDYLGEIYRLVILEKFDDIIGPIVNNTIYICTTAAMYKCNQTLVTVTPIGDGGKRGDGTG